MAVASLEQTTTHKFTTADYHRMAEVGILHPRARVELIEGVIVDMSPIGRQHQSTVDRLNARFSHALLDLAVVRVQGSVRLSEFSEPEPDLLVLRWEPDYYLHRFAGPLDVLLLIEVSDSTFRYDRDVKAPLYARAEIPEYWIVDLPRQRILVHRNPSAGQYQEISEIRSGDPLSPAAFPELTLPVSDILVAPADED